MSVVPEKKIGEFNDIYIDFHSITDSETKLPRGNFFYPGKLRFAPRGIGWKGKDDLYTIPIADVRRFTWSRGCRRFELRITKKDQNIIRLQGFQKPDLDKLKDIVKKDYKLNLEEVDLSIKGRNWGKAEFQGTDLIFADNDLTVLEFPINKVTNSNMVNKNEVSLEFLSPAEPQAKLSGDLKVANFDELVELRLYIPNTNPTSTNKGEKGEDDEDIEEVEQLTKAGEFNEFIKERANLQVMGDAIAKFDDTLFVTPRGRYDVEMFPTFFRLRGKTYDYKLLYTNINRLFFLPRPDGLHTVLVVGLDPPLRQGQTRYPYLVMQWNLNDTSDIEINLDDAELKESFDGLLQKTYSQATMDTVAEVFTILSGRKLIKTENYLSHHGNAAFKCSLKANEGTLYPLENTFLFIPKPPFEIPHKDIGSISFSRVGSGTVSTGSRTFDVKFNLKGGASYQFSSVNKEEYKGIEIYLKVKGIKFKDEVAEQVVNFSDMGDSDNEGYIGNDSNDDESPDEDFVAQSDSEVGEEYDENFSAEEPDDE